VGTRTPRTLIVFALLGGVVAAFVTWLGSLVVGIAAGVLTLAAGLVAIGWATSQGMTSTGPGDPARRRFLVQAGAGGLAWVAGGAVLGRIATNVARPDATAVQEAAAADLGTEYMDLVARTYHAGRSGDLQLLLAPFNSANYENESRSLLPRDPRSSHASTWMYLERIPLVVHGPGIVATSDSEERVTLADLAPTTASLIGFDEWPGDREGRMLPDLQRTEGYVGSPQVVVTFVIDGGGWNVLHRWPDRWPNLRRLMGEGANYRNAIMGSFPAVTACAHATIGTGTFPRQHGITGHNIRDGIGVRKAYRTPGLADPSDILVPTLADLWHEATGAWVGEVGYQVWHMGMLGFGGRGRPANDLPVGVYFDEDGGRGWLPHHPDLYRLPNQVPDLASLEQAIASFPDPGWDPAYAQWGNPYCCAPPIAAYQEDLLEATLASEDIGGEAASLLYTTYKSPDYTGHVYGMDSEWTGLMLEAVDAQIGRMQAFLEERFPGAYVLIVTADHGQCPLPDSMGGVRLDPVQLGRIVEEEFGAGLGDAGLSVVPSEIYLNVDALGDAGATVDDVAAYLRHLPYRRTIGPYVPASAIEQQLLDREEFAAVFGTPYLDTLGDVGRFGAGIYDGDDVDPGIPDAV
jgi:hypothetical protein